MDCLRRDSYYLGVIDGMFDLGRVIHTLTRTPEPAASLAIDAKGGDALENYRLARYLMHAHVYKHHTRLAADQMFLRAVDMAIHEEGVIQADAPKLSASDFLDFYMGLDGDSVCSIILNSEDAVASRDTIRRIGQRKLLRRICQFTHLVGTNLGSFPRTQNNLDEIGERLAHKFGIPPHDLIFYKSERNIKLYDLDDLPVVEDGQLSSVERNSPVTKKADVVTFYVFGPPDRRQGSYIESDISRELGVDLDYV